MDRIAFAAVRIRDAFWSIPALALVLAVALAEGLVLLDRAAAPDGGLITDIGPDGSRALLGAIATATLAAASTMFSITIAVLALTASAYGPRIVRSVMADSGNRVVLATLVATSLYALLVLRHVRSGSSAFVPSVAVMVGIGLTVLCIALLVYFIHHISTGIQISTLASAVRRELRDRLDEAYPLESADSLVSDARWPAEGSVRSIAARADGYVADVGIDDLVQAARRYDSRIDVVVRPGTFVVTGDPIARVPGDAHSDLDDAVCRAVAIGDERTPYQDVEHLTRQLVDIAVRALSTGVNDPHTAVVAVDAVLAAVAPTADRPEPLPVVLDGDREPRLRVARRRWIDTVLDAIDTVRVCAAADPLVVARLTELVARLAERTSDPERRDALRAAAERIAQTVEAGPLIAADRERLAASARQAVPA